MKDKPTPVEAASNGPSERHKPWVLTYHSITPSRSRYIYGADCRQFENHLAWIARMQRESGIAPEITFDDGALSDFEFAMPLLNKYSLRAKFFIVAGLMGNRVDFLTWDQVREIAGHGHAIQSHSWSHPLLTRVTQDQIVRELEKSKKEIEDRLGLPVNEISLPGGRWNESVLEACAEAGYARVYHSNPWQSRAMRNGVEFIGRLMVRNSMTVERLQGLLGGNYRELARYRFQHVLKESGKKLIGDRVYHWFWQRIAQSARGTPSPSGEL